MKHGIIELFSNAYIKNLKPESLAADPQLADLTGVGVARIWFNETDKALKFFDGAEVMQLATGGTLEDYVRHDGTVAMTADLVLSSTDQSGSADNVAVSKGHLNTELAKKEDVLTGAASSIAHTDLDAEKVAVSDAGGKVAASAITTAELGSLAGMTDTVVNELAKKEDKLGFVPLDVAGSNAMTAALAMGSNQITGVTKGTEADHAVNLSQLENALAGLDFQKDVNDVIVDNTYDLSGAVEGDRFVVVDAASVPAELAGVADLANGDIVEHNGTEFVIAYDVSEKGAGALVWNIVAGEFVRWDGASWDKFGGLSGVTAGAGLKKNGDEIFIVHGGGIGFGADGDTVTVEVYNVGSLQLVDPTTGDASQAADAVLALKLDGAALESTVDGLRIAAQGVTEREIAASVAGFGIQGGNGVALAVQASDASIVVEEAGVKVSEDHLNGIYARQDGATFTAEIGVVDATADNHAMPKSQIVQTITDMAGAKIDEFAQRFEASYVSKTADAPSLTHDVQHDMGTQAVQVVCYDEAGFQFIPDSVQLVDDNNITVTVTESIICTVVVQGLKAATPAV